MARINIEERWWTDPRRSALIKRLKSEELADGSMLKAWRTAQEYWKKGKSQIPVEIFSLLEGSVAMLEVGLAVVRDGLVYVRGSKDLLDWARTQSEMQSEKGKKSAEARRKKNGTAQPKRRTEVEPKPNQDRTDTDRIEPSVSGSVSDSVSDSDSGFEEEGANGTPSTTPNENLGPIIELVGISPEIDFVLAQISRTSQETWMKQLGGREPMRTFLETTIAGVLAKEGVATVSEIPDWGRKLHGWVSTERKSKPNAFASHYGAFKSHNDCFNFLERDSRTAEVV